MQQHCLSFFVMGYYIYIYTVYIPQDASTLRPEDQEENHRIKGMHGSFQV